MMIAKLTHSDNKRVWEFLYKMQYEEPRVKVASSDDDYTLLLTWNKGHAEKEGVANDLD
jgi:hypothetical protein